MTPAWPHQAGVNRYLRLNIQTAIPLIALNPNAIPKDGYGLRFTSDKGRICANFVRNALTAE